MSDSWMPTVRIIMTAQQFHQLPRHPAYLYNYCDGQAILLPRAKYYHARLQLAQYQPPIEASSTPTSTLRRVERADEAVLTQLFAWAFATVQPYAGLEQDQLHTAAHDAMVRVFTGEQGPWIEAASFLAMTADQKPCGAILITLLPLGRDEDYDSYFWDEPPPPNCVADRLGRPHLTWIFVDPLEAVYGLGTHLLLSAVSVLRALGFAELLTTILIGNDASLLWHWRNGFELLPSRFSFRRLPHDLAPPPTPS